MRELKYILVWLLLCSLFVILLCVLDKNIRDGNPKTIYSFIYVFLSSVSFNYASLTSLKEFYDRNNK